RVPTVADLPLLEYTMRVIHESMRLYPPAWFTSRKAIHDDVIGGVHIPAGSTVLVLPWVTHRDPRFWENPEGFDPDRFSPEVSASRPKLAYFPFSAGPRMCIGNTFATMEMQLVLAMVVQRYRLDLVPGARVEPDPQVTLRPKSGVPVHLRPRT
ncbi:MAG: cytochrome P450, partial [Myxococcaceae bacterium]